MKRIAVISDLHLDFWASALRTTPYLLYKSIENRIDKSVDMVVIAGDMMNGGNTKIMETNLDPLFLFVPGNHDFYGSELPKTPEIYHQDGVIAATLWTGFANGEHMAQVIYDQIADSHAIVNTSAFAVQQLFAETATKILDSDAQIVITHFPPSGKSTADQYVGNSLNPYFVNNLDLRITYHPTFNAKLWICGHVHHRHSYYLGDMLVVCNPLGYPGERFRHVDQYQPMYLSKIDDKWVVD